MAAEFHLAQCNISKLKAALTDPSMKEFTDFLEPVNSFADKMDGFIWRLKGQYGEASSNLPSAFEDDRMIINITVWKNIDALKKFTFQTVHSYFLRNKNLWTDKVLGYQFVMWWVPAGHIPTVDEAKSKLIEIEKNGSLPNAFNWKKQFDWNGNLLTDELSK